MSGHSRSKNGVASLAYVPAIHVLLAAVKQDVDARHKAGHDGDMLCPIPGLRYGGGERRRRTMPGKTVKIRSTDGGEFDCYLSMLAGGDKAPAVVLASAVYGVDKDLCDIADEFAAAGYIAAAPDL